MDTCRSTSVSAAAVAACLLLSAAALGAEAFTVSGATSEGDFATEAGSIAFQGEAGKIDLDQLARVDIQQFRGGIPIVSGILTDRQDRISGIVRIGSTDTIAVNSPRLGSLEFPAQNVSEVYFSRREAMPEGDSPVVLLRNGDVMPVQSVSLSQTYISMKSDVGRIELPLERVAAVRFGAPGAAPSETALLLDNGDVVTGKLLSASREGFAVDSLAGALRISAPLVVRVDFPPRLAYLSDLESTLAMTGFAPETVSYFSRDRDPDGRPLRSAAAVFRKGLFTRAGAAVTVTLPAGARTLRFVPAVAAGASPPQGTCTVQAGGRTLWSMAVSAATPNEPVAVDLGGADKVTLVYESGPPGLIGSSAVWGDAFVTVESR